MDKYRANAEAMRGLLKKVRVHPFSHLKYRLSSLTNHQLELSGNHNHHVSWTHSTPSLQQTIQPPEQNCPPSVVSGDRGRRCVLTPMQRPNAIVSKGCTRRQ